MAKKKNFEAAPPQNYVAGLGAPRFAEASLAARAQLSALHRRSRRDWLYDTVRHRSGSVGHIAGRA